MCRSNDAEVVSSANHTRIRTPTRKTGVVLHLHNRAWLHLRLSTKTMSYRRVERNGFVGCLSRDEHCTHCFLKYGRGASSEYGRTYRVVDMALCTERDCSVCSPIAILNN